ncbi:MAG: NUDIX hydrolase [Dermatophilaceae bacterium]
MRRTTYIDDPAAPEINSVVPSVFAVVQDDAGRVLLLHDLAMDMWTLPEGTHRPGEFIADTVAREVKEEAGFDVKVVALVGTYTNPRHVTAYGTGEVRQEFSLAFRAKLAGGQARPTGSGHEPEWLTPAQIDMLDLDAAVRLRLRHALNGQDRPFIG